MDDEIFYTVHCLGSAVGLVTGGAAVGCLSNRYTIRGGSNCKLCKALLSDLVH